MPYIGYLDYLSVLRNYLTQTITCNQKEIYGVIFGGQEFNWLKLSRKPKSIFIYMFVVCMNIDVGMLFGSS